MIPHLSNPDYKSLVQLRENFLLGKYKFRIISKKINSENESYSGYFQKFFLTEIYLLHASKNSKHFLECNEIIKKGIPVWFSKFRIDFETDEQLDKVHKWQISHLKKHLEEYLEQIQYDLYWDNRLNAGN